MRHDKGVQDMKTHTKLLSAAVVMATGVVTACSSSSSPQAVTTPPASTSASASTAPSGAPIVIGNIGSYSGPTSSNSGGYRAGLSLWQAYINANGGINGHPVQVKTVDDAGDPTKALTLAHTLVQTDHVAAILAPASSALGWQQYVSDAGVPAITASGYYGVTPGLTFSAETSLDTNNQTQAIMAKKAGAKSYAFIYCSEIAACQKGKEDNQHYALKYGLKYSSHAASGSAPDYTAICLSMKKDKVDAVALDAFPATSVRLVADCARQNYHPQYLTVGVAITPDMTTNKNFEGILVSLIDFPWLANDTPATQTFHNAITQFNPGLVNKPAEYNANLSATWAAAMTFTKAAQAATDPTKSADLIKGLATISNDNLGGLTPPLTFGTAALPDSPKTYKQPNVTCFFVVQSKGGTWVRPTWTDQNSSSCV
jgi:branched-chain amino acid transport system substrate-binding protein